MPPKRKRSDYYNEKEDEARREELIREKRSRTGPRTARDREIDEELSDIHYRFENRFNANNGDMFDKVLASMHVSHEKTSRDYFEREQRERAENYARQRHAAELRRDWDEDERRFSYSHHHIFPEANHYFVRADTARDDLDDIDDLMNMVTEDQVDQAREILEALGANPKLFRDQNAMYPRGFARFILGRWNDDESSHDLPSQLVNGEYVNFSNTQILVNHFRTLYGPLALCRLIEYMDSFGENGNHGIDMEEAWRVLDPADITHEVEGPFSAADFIDEEDNEEEEED